MRNNNLKEDLLKMAAEMAKNKTEFTPPKAPPVKQVNTGSEQGKLPDLPYNPTSNVRAVTQARLSQPRQPVIVDNNTTEKTATIKRYLQKYKG